MALHYGPAVLAAMAAGLQSAVDSAGAGSVLLFYAGVQPAGGGAASGAEQARATLANPCGVRTGSVIDLVVPIEAIRTAGDPITWARWQDSAGVWLMDLGVSAAGSGGQIELDHVDGYPGGTVTITAGSIGF